jgi:hypothetical protein
MSDLVGIVDRKARKPWMTQEIIVKWMNEGSGGRRSTMKKEGRTAECYVRLNQGQTRSVRAGRGFKQGCCLNSVCTGNTLPRLWEFKNRRNGNLHYETCR